LVGLITKRDVKYLPATEDYEDEDVEAIAEKLLNSERVRSTIIVDKEQSHQFRHAGKRRYPNLL
jgi:hypothetical protein